MHDLRALRADPAAFDAGLARRGLAPCSANVLALDSDHRAALTSLQEAQAQRNDLSQTIGALKKAGKNASEALREVAHLKDAMAEMEEKAKVLGVRLDARLAEIPNIPLPEVPDGPDESANVEIRRVGSPRLLNSARSHEALGEESGFMDFEAAARLSGARFTILKGPLAKLERALGAFMLDLHTTEFGYTEVSPPLMVREEIMYGTAQLPKFAEDQFQTTSGMWLIPTAEVPLTNLVRESLLERESLPRRFTALTACFRAEAGAAGRDTRGMLRQHQFYKVEMVSITAPEQSAEEHERMTACAETVLKRLGLPFRTVVLCTGDMGFASRKTYDIEVWMPSQNLYREISSCSTCGDFQARRMNARCRAAGDKTSTFVHTLNGSGVAVGRCLIAVMENFQEPDGSIVLPPALRPYMGGMEVIPGPALSRET